MKILRKKNITEAVETEKNPDLALQPAQVDKLEPVVDHTTANTLASKEDNEAAAEKNIEASGIKEVADEVVKSIQDPKKDTEAPKTPSMKPYTEGKDVVDRKELSQLIRECKEKGKKYRISRSIKEGFRYVFEELEDEIVEPEITAEEPAVEPETGEEAAEETNEEEVTFESEIGSALKPIILARLEKEQLTSDLVKQAVNTWLADEQENGETFPETFFVTVEEEPAQEEPVVGELTVTDAAIEEPIEEGKEVCPECGKEVCECNKNEQIDEAIVAPVSEPGDEEEIEPVVTEVEITPEEETVPAVELAGEIEVKEPELAAEEDPEIEIDSIETFVPTGEKAQSTMTTIKDAGEGAMFAFKDTLKDLFNLKIKVSDLQKLLSDSSDWLLDLLGFNSQPEEPTIAPEEIPEPSAEEMAEINSVEVDEDPAPVNDVTSLDINSFDDVEPIDTEGEEDQNFFVGD